MIGRCGIVHVNSKQCDLLLTYPPPRPPYTKGNEKVFKSVFDWVNKTFKKHGAARRFPIFMCDANARIGLTRNISGEWIVNSSRHVGPIAPVQEDIAGSIFRHCLTVNELVAFNTFVGTGSPTFFGGNRVKTPSRIDYVSGPRDMITAGRITAAETLMEAAECLQAKPAAQPNDHVPLLVIADLRLGYCCPHNSPSIRWDRTALVKACMKGSQVTHACRDQLQTCAAEIIRECDSTSFTTLSLNTIYFKVLNCLKDIGAQRFAIKHDSHGTGIDRRAASRLRLALLYKRRTIRFETCKLCANHECKRWLANMLRQWMVLSKVEPLQRQLKVLSKLDTAMVQRIHEYELNMA